MAAPNYPLSPFRISTPEGVVSVEVTMLGVVVAIEHHRFFFVVRGSTLAATGSSCGNKPRPGNQHDASAMLPADLPSVQALRRGSAVMPPRSRLSRMDRDRRPSLRRRRSPCHVALHGAAVKLTGKEQLVIALYVVSLVALALAVAFFWPLR